MKKLLLLAASGLVALGANAQNAEKSVVFVNGAKTKVAADKYNFNDARVRQLGTTATANKGTAGPGSRWYAHYEAVDLLNSGAIQNNRGLFPIWFDSTIRQRFFDGTNFFYGAINYSSVSQFIDPIRYEAFNSPTFGNGTYNGLIVISPTTTYTVDSVDIVGAYVRIKNKPNVVDTMIFSVAPSTGVYRIRKSNTNTAWAGNYLPAGKDTLYAHTILNVDSVNRAAFSDVASANRVIWKKVLTAAMGDTATAAGTVTLQSFTEPVPGGGLSIPAGNGFSITATFKSGDTWVKNVDTVNGMNRFLPLSSSIGDGARMPYYYYDYNDRNMSNLMFSTDTSTYLPSIIIEGINTTGFDNEFHWIAGHVKCTSCEVVSVKDRAGIISEVGNAYPNPARTEVTVPFIVKETTNVNVSVSNALGQVVKMQNVGKVAGGQNAKATFTTSDLTNGVYFITVEANGQRVTNRFVVNH